MLHGGWNCIADVSNLDLNYCLFALHNYIQQEYNLATCVFDWYICVSCAHALKNNELWDLLFELVTRTHIYNNELWSLLFLCYVALTSKNAAELDMVQWLELHCSCLELGLTLLYVRFAHLHSTRMQSCNLNGRLMCLCVCLVHSHLKQRTLELTICCWPCALTFENNELWSLVFVG